MHGSGLYPRDAAIGAQTTARCGAPNWEQSHVGCFAKSALSGEYAGEAGSAITFESGFFAA